MTTTRTDLTTDDIEAGYENEEWLGHGYLGERQYLTDEQRASADAFVVKYANDHGWTADRLFEWLNSRPGRHFADDWTIDARWATTLLGADLSQ